MITGTFDRSTLTFTPDHTSWAEATLSGDNDAAKHFAYDYTAALFPKVCDPTSTPYRMKRCKRGGVQTERLARREGEGARWRG
jgi:hypothetical protein